MSLEGDIFGDPNAAATEPVKPIVDSSGDIFASAVSQPEMKSVSLDTPPISPVSVPTPVAAPVMAPVTLSAAPSVPETPVGGGQANDLFNDSDKTSTKKTNVPSDVSIFVNEPRKMGEGIGGFIVYTVKTETTRTSWNGKTFEVTRRFSDFLGLYEKLAGKYQHKGYYILPAPEKSIMSFTKVKVQGAGEDDQFVVRRQHSLQRWLRTIVKHHALTKDPDIQAFLTQDAIAPATSTRAISVAGALRMIGKVENAITKQVTQRMVESEPWFEERTNQVNALQDQLKRLAGSAGNLSVHRKDLSLSAGDLGRASSMLSNTEEKPQLSRQLSNLGTLYENLGEIYGDLSDKDLFNFSELLSDQVRGLDGVRSLLSAREKMWQNWQSSEQTLLKKRETITRLQATGRTEKIPGAELEIKDWEGRVQQNRKAFEEMSATAKSEINIWEGERVRDTKAFMTNWMKDMLEAERKIVKMWEQYLPKA
jgi:sorting nexin-1/2